MFCPECHAEYRLGFTTCSDCQVDLVESLPGDRGPSDPEPDLELVTVFRTADPGEVTLIKSLLEDAGIDYLIRNEATHYLVPSPRFSVDVQVRQEDQRTASRLLSNLRGEED